MHFQLHLAALLDHPRGALGPIARTLAAADLSMVNLESAITDRGTPNAKELEAAGQRYYYRTSPAALEVLVAAGIDVVTIANNHGADYGPIGLKDTLAAIRTSPIPVIGIGRDRQAAFAPYRVSIRGTDFAFFGADASQHESASSVWEAGPTTPGIAAAHAARPRALIAAVRAASRQVDVVVVYLHWGAELQGCPTAQQQTTARALAEAGADVIVGSHAHVLLGSGWLGDTYVDYGLGNFLWYHNHHPMLPITLSMLVLAARGGRFAARIGPRLPMTLGPMVVGGGTLLLIRIGPETRYWLDVFPGVTLVGLGLALLVAALTSTVLTAAPDHNAGIASGINNAVARAGSLLAIAALPAAVGLSGGDYQVPAAFGEAFGRAMLACTLMLVSGGVLAWFTIRNPRAASSMNAAGSGADVD